MNIFRKVYCRAFQKVMYIAEFFMPWREPVSVVLPQYLTGRGIRRVLFVTDSGLTKIGLPNAMLADLRAAGIECEVFDGVVPNPTIDNVERCVELYHSRRCEAIIAFGGGSPMDCAKVTAARIGNPRRSVRKLEGLLKVSGRLPLLIAVPTTAGTGSEATLAAVITDSENHHKYPINDPQLIPHAVVLDPTLTIGLPPHITSTTGMDALCHAVEAYIGGSNTKNTERYATEAVQLIFGNLETAYSAGANLEARRAMQEAAYLAGMAFTRAYVGAVHAMAHALGGRYGIAHGLANAVILPHVLREYSTKAHRRLARLARAIGIEGGSDAALAEAFIAEIEAMNARMDIPSHLNGIRSEDIPDLALTAEHECNPLYPTPALLDTADFERLFGKVSEKTH